MITKLENKTVVQIKKNSDKKLLLWKSQNFPFTKFFLSFFFAPSCQLLLQLRNLKILSELCVERGTKSKFPTASRLGGWTTCSDSTPANYRKEKFNGRTAGKLTWRRGYCSSWSRSAGGCSSMRLGSCAPPEPRWSLRSDISRTRLSRDRRGTVRSERKWRKVSFEVILWF